MKANRRQFLETLGVGSAGLTIGSAVISPELCTASGMVESWTLWRPLVAAASFDSIFPEK